jgi:hypothetical protein
VDFARTLGVLVDFFEREGLHYAAVGAFALHAYGLTRATLALDLATERGVQGRVVEFLEPLGYETLHRSAGYSNHAHPLADLGRVDLIYVDGDTARLLLAPGGRMLTLGDRRVPRAESGAPRGHEGACHGERPDPDASGDGRYPAPYGGAGRRS